MSLVNNISGDTEKVVEYLRHHPDFFADHPELLPALTIPYTTEKNVSSLLEYQVTKLRQQVTELQRRVVEMESGSDSDMKFSAQMHSLSLVLLTCKTAEELYLTLQKGLKTHYSTDRVLLLVFTKSHLPQEHSGLRFISPVSKLRFMFTEVFHRNKPLCGSLQEEHLIALFGSDAERIKSSVLLPHQQSSWQGLLVLGSREQNLYGQGPELDLLIYVKEIVYLMLRQFIETTSTPDQPQHRPQSG